jgi:NADPH:quinone reductase-like Zn-dependent oxidoreductase
LALGLPDVFMCRGTYAFNPAIPFTPGQEVVGIVTAAGEGVDRNWSGCCGQPGLAFGEHDEDVDEAVAMFGGGG